jgi:hypothetical protein
MLIRKPLAVLCIAAILAAALVPGALFFVAALIVVAAILPFAPAAALGRLRVEIQPAPRFLLAAVSFLRAPPLRVA